MLFNIHTLDWDDEIARDARHAARDAARSPALSSEVYGETRGRPASAAPIPIAGVAGDQQAATFGQACFAPGMAKNTYGTGCFLLLNTGEKAASSQQERPADHDRLGPGRQESTYCLEGSVFIAGAAVQWLRDGLGSSSTPPRRRGARGARCHDTGGVYLVPAFVGLGAPYWDPYARGAIVGLTRGTGARATSPAPRSKPIAYQTRDVLRSDAARTRRRRCSDLRVDGGMVANNFLMQFQADILGVPVQRPSSPRRRRSARPIWRAWRSTIGTGCKMSPTTGHMTALHPHR